MARVWLVTGSSSGIGRALVERALAHGDKVVATARRPESLAELQAAYPEQCLVLALDVTAPDQVHSCVADALNHFGRLDVLVNNAGYGLMGAVEDVTDEQIRAQFETNLFGTLAVIRAALPTLRRQGSGHIINITSVGGRESAPLIGIYSATKYALEGLSESLARELEPFGVHVTAVAPGAYATRFGNSSLTVATPSAPYQPIAEAMQAHIKDLPHGDPATAAEALVELVNSDKPPLRLLLGEAAADRIAAGLREQLQEIETWHELSVRAAPL